MMHHLLADACKSCVFGEIRYITVHVAVYLYMLHDVGTICFESAVEVMQILDSADFAGCGVE